MISELEEIESFVELDETEQTDDATGIKTKFIESKHTYFSWHDKVEGHYATGITRKIAMRSYFDFILDVVSSLSFENEEMKDELSDMAKEISELKYEVCMMED